MKSLAENKRMLQEVEAIITEEAKNNIPKATKEKTTKWMTKETTEIANYWRNARKTSQEPNEKIHKNVFVIKM